MTTPTVIADSPAEMTFDQLRARTARAQMYIVYNNPTEQWTEPTPEPGGVLHNHFCYLTKLENEGLLFGWGRVAYEGSRPGEGLAIIAAASRAEAEKIAANEPFHKAGRRVNTVRGYTSNEGVACYIARAMSRRAIARGEGFDLIVTGNETTVESTRARAAGATIYLLQMEPTGRTKTPDEERDVGQAHFVWLRENEMAARLLSCGPTERLDGKEGGNSGLALMAAPDLAEARRLADAEPNTARGFRAIGIKTWTPNHGIAAPVAKALMTLVALG